MPLTKGATYVSAIPPLSSTGDPIPLRRTLQAPSFDRLADPLTGEVWTLSPLQRARADEWYFLRTDGFNPRPLEVPTLKQLVWEGVRAYPDLTREGLHAALVAQDPRGGKAMKIDSLSGALSADARIDMFKDGVRVDKLGHELRYCTFRPTR